MSQPTVTRTPGPNTPTPASGGGTIQIYKLACEGPESLTRINVLPPGEEATRDDLGDATCFGGNSTFTLRDASGNLLQSVDVPTSGILVISDIQPGTYRIEDTLTSVTADLEVRAGLTTRVISLFYEDPGDIVDDTPPVIPEVTIEDPEEFPTSPSIDVEDPEFAFDGPVAIPSDSDPFTVEDDPEAANRVNAVDSFESLPGVGIGPDRRPSHQSRDWVVAIAALIALLTAIRLRRQTGNR